MVRIIKITKLPDNINFLALESESQGFRFVRRLKDEYENKLNIFGGHGEALFVAIENDTVIAIGGVNSQIINKDSIGRIRRFYVSEASRSTGVGRKLLSAIESHAFKYYKRLVLNTDTPEASKFYERCGFTAVGRGNISHEKQKRT